MDRFEQVLRSLYLVLCMCSLLSHSSLYADEFDVGDVKALEDAIHAAGPGDTILIRPGIYSDVSLLIESGDIVIAGANITSPPNFIGHSSFTLNNSNILLKNLKFDGITSGTIIKFGSGSGSSIEDSSFVDCGNNEIRSRHLVRILPQAKGVTVTGNKFVRSKSMSVGVVIDRSTVGGHHVIRNNEFRDTLRTVENGLEPIQIGQNSNFHHVEANVSIMKNLFDNTKGDDETVSLKSSQNIVSGNVFRKASSMNLRGGKSNKVDGNCFIDTPYGIRGYGGSHAISNNLFVAGVTAVFFHESGHNILEGNRFVVDSSVLNLDDFVDGFIDEIQFLDNSIYFSDLKVSDIEFSAALTNDFRSIEQSSVESWKNGGSSQNLLYVNFEGESLLEIKTADQCSSIVSGHSSLLFSPPLPPSDFGSY